MTRDEPEPRLVDLTTAAERLSVSVRTLRRAIDLRRIHAVRVGTGRGVWRISEAEIRRLVIDGTNQQINDEARRLGYGRMHSAYPIDPDAPCTGYGDNTLWIITEYDHRTTTILLPEEY